MKDTKINTCSDWFVKNTGNKRFPAVRMNYALKPEISSAQLGIFSRDVAGGAFLMDC